MAEIEDNIAKRRAYRREWMRAHRAANREEYNASMRAWRAANREQARKIAAKGHKKWAEANPEKAKEVGLKAAAKWRAKNPPSINPRHVYAMQKCGAKYRRIAFLLTFEQWMAIWLDSGKWEQRGGKLDEYCMARYRDQGAYAVGNVRICTNRENFAEHHEIRRGKSPSEETRRKLSAAAKARYLRERSQR